MKNTVRKIINFRFDRYQETERKLEELAAEGLLLEKCGTLFWTFRKGEPKKLNYTIAFFEEGSVFNPDITDNQQLYFEYAAAAGWDLVSQLNQMHVFCSEADNFVPFETDEKEKFNTIKRSMKKGFVQPIAMLMLLFLASFAGHFYTFWVNPIVFFSNKMELLETTMAFVPALYFAYLLLDYFVWCRRSEQSIANGGECVCNTSKIRSAIDFLFICLILGIVGSMLVDLAFKIKGVGVALCIAQVPVQLLVFWSTIKYLKKKRVSATVNKILSFVAMIVANLAYMLLIILFIIKLGDHKSTPAEYKTIHWELGEIVDQEYRLYNEKLPLTCEDLYGKSDYPYYSKEKMTSSTFLLKKSNYYQNPLPGESAPPYLEYDIFESDFEFVIGAVKKQTLKLGDWEGNIEIRRIDNESFGTLEAYQKYEEGTPTGKYILRYPGKLIVLTMEEPATVKQMEQIKEKL